jgi:hypothetical protein
MLQYTLRQTQDQVSPWEGSFTDILETPLASPNTDYSEACESSSKRFSFEGSNSTRKNSKFPLPQVKEDYLTHFASEPVPNPYATPESSTSPPPRIAESEPQQERSRKRKSWQREILPSSDVTVTTVSKSPEPGQQAKRNHSCVERAYRDRLNDKIEALAGVLFDSVSAKGLAAPPMIK